MTVRINRSLIVALAALPLLATPTLARDHHAPGERHIGAALKAGCKVHQVHTPAGKPVQASPIITCPADAQFAKAKPVTPVASTATAQN